LASETGQWAIRTQNTCQWIFAYCTLRLEFFWMRN
jgi:hypothetical protein